MEIVQVGDTVVMKNEFLEGLLAKVSKDAAKAGIESYKVEKSKDIKYSASQVAKLLKCSTPTVLRYIKLGKKNSNGRGKVKLKAIRKGEKIFEITQYDLNEFKELTQ